MTDMTRRRYLLEKVLLDSIGSGGSVSMFMAMEAVDSTALAHPEWDMEEVKSWDEWEAG